MKHIHPLEPIGVIVLIVVLWYLRKKKAEQAGGAKGSPARNAGAAVERAARPEPQPEAVYMNLRRRAIETVPDTLGLPGEIKEQDAYGLLMEMAVPNSTVTLACFANGEANLYYRTGGGMVGGIAHENVRNAAKELVALAQQSLPLMSKTRDYPLPGQDSVRFYALTPRGVLSTETDRAALADPQNELSALFYSGQEVVSQMRQAQAEKSAAKAAAS